MVGLARIVSASKLNLSIRTRRNSFMRGGVSRSLRAASALGEIPAVDDVVDVIISEHHVGDLGR